MEGIVNLPVTTIIPYIEVMKNESANKGGFFSEILALGDEKIADSIARKVLKEIPAYSRFLEVNDHQPDSPFDSYPITDKQNYIRAYDQADLAVQDSTKIASYVRSSGTMGREIYWPQLVINSQTLARQNFQYFENNFHISKKRTVVVIAMHTSGWYGGECFNQIFRALAQSPGLDMHVVSLGCDYEVIIDYISKNLPPCEQVLIVTQPFTAKIFLQSIKKDMHNTPWSKVRFYLAGEPFTESWRVDVQDDSDVAMESPFMLSGYGAADVGGLGVESRYGVALRRLVSRYPAMADEMGFEGLIPAFYHFSASDVYLEIENENLLVTRWQGVPLVRYNLKDRVRFFDWEEIRSFVAQWEGFSDEDLLLRDLVLRSPSVMPPVVAVHGRSIGLHFYGFLLSEAHIVEVLDAVSAKASLSGEFRARMLAQEYPSVELTLELKSGADGFAELKELEAEVNSLFSERISIVKSVLGDVLAGLDQKPTLFVVKTVPWKTLSKLSLNTVKQKRLE